MSTKKKAVALTKPMSKTEMVSEIAQNTGVTKKDVSAFFSELESIIIRHLGKKSVGQFVLPGLVKIEHKKVPAQKAQKNVPHPFKPGETYDKPARPASLKIKVRALKKVKDLVV